MTLYIQRGCLFSDEAVARLTKQRIPFTARDIEADPQALAELEAFETLVTPTMVVGDEVIYGFDTERLSRLLASPVENSCTGDREAEAGGQVPVAKVALALRAAGRQQLNAG